MPAAMTGVFANRVSSQHLRISLISITAINWKSITQGHHACLTLYGHSWAFCSGPQGFCSIRQNLVSKPQSSFIAVDHIVCIIQVYSGCSHMSVLSPKAILLFQLIQSSLVQVDRHDGSPNYRQVSLNSEAGSNPT